MTSTRFFGLTHAQWERVAEFWRATEGALPAPVAAEGSRLLEHYYAFHVCDPADLYTFTDARGEPIRWIQPTTVEWVRKLWASALRECFPGNLPERPPRPEGKGTRVWR